MSAADPIAALIAIAAADSEVSALAGDRIYGAEVPEAEAASTLPKMLVLRPSGGASLMSGSYVEHDTQRIDAFTYGETPAEAGKLMRAFALCMKRVRRQVAAGCLIHSVGSAGGNISGREPDTDWPRAFQSFQVFHALEAVA